MADVPRKRSTNDLKSKGGLAASAAGAPGAGAAATTVAGDGALGFTCLAAAGFERIGDCATSAGAAAGLVSTSAEGAELCGGTIVSVDGGTLIGAAGGASGGDNGEGVVFVCVQPATNSNAKILTNRGFVITRVYTARAFVACRWRTAYQTNPTRALIRAHSRCTALQA